MAERDLLHQAASVAEAAFETPLVFSSYLQQVNYQWETFKYNRDSLKKPDLQVVTRLSHSLYGELIRHEYEEVERLTDLSSILTQSEIFRAVRTNQTGHRTTIALDMIGGTTIFAGQSDTDGYGWVVAYDDPLSTQLKVPLDDEDKGTIVPFVKDLINEGGFRDFFRAKTANEALTPDFPDLERLVDILGLTFFEVDQLEDVSAVDLCESEIKRRFDLRLDLLDLSAA